MQKFRFSAFREPATLLKMISFAGVFQRFLPELPEEENSYFVEHFLMANSKNIKICNSLLY